MSDEQPAHRNRLADETSPYLLQHAANPVDWYPWGEEAFERARANDSPILLSVGYSSCHWCHVMAHESFEDESIAAVMNEKYVNIKVDREERPDVDSVYMTATQAMTGQGGWPMTVFMTPEGEPFYAGTYFPPDDGHGRPGFRRVLEALRHSWDTDRENLLASASRITEQLQAATEREASGDATVTADLTAGAVDRLRVAYDATWGGFGAAPKFPNPATLEFLLLHDHAATTTDAGQPGARTMAIETLRSMALGGMYDHLGGGFARYSVDREWLVPHFEKMLYDNAQLVRAYTHAWQVTGDDLFERVVRETLAYLEREMLHADGGFYSAQDADSEGIEGKFFVWTPPEFADVLGPDEGSIAAEVYGVTVAGNFQDPHHPEFGRRNVLTRRAPLNHIARSRDTTVEAIEERIPGWRERLLAERETRVRPGLDDKVLTSWNGLALAAFAEAGRVLGEPSYVAVAERNAAFVRDAMWRDGRLLHTWKDGRARIDGMIEDYTYYGLGLVELYRATGDLDHLHWAAELLDVVVERFRDPEGGGVYEAASDAERLILRQKPLFDAASPSGNGAAALLAFWLGRYFGRPEWGDFAREVVRLVRDHLVQAANGFGSVLQVVDLLLAPPREIAVVGDAAARAPFEREIASHYLPAVLLAPADGEGLPVLEGRAVADGAAAYVCENLVCNLPATSVEELAAQLAD
ncbi:MAG: thioredoxin domain-containing protein [Chloroflexi bacterium]|nr:thioredoxin domain-containing protein [Chloroflexota bacterium]MYD66359.1 thioredoxin domain-containing protein [Chloroflexota bacterium]